MEKYFRLNQQRRWQSYRTLCSRQQMLLIISLAQIQKNRLKIIEYMRPRSMDRESNSILISISNRKFLSPTFTPFSSRPGAKKNKKVRPRALKRRFPHSSRSRRRRRRQRVEVVRSGAVSGSSVNDKINICNILSLNINVMQKFEDIQFVGEGSFSTVYRARRKLDGKTYALKKMSMSCLSNQERFNCLNEIKLLSRLTHPNIIQYKDAFFEEDNLYLVTQFAENGDFLQFMMKRRKQRSPLSEEEICVFARQMANGLNGLHKTNILHRDVKAANFFLASENKVKLGDMNVSSISRSGMAITKIGTPYYTSPEIWQELPYSFKSDIWSFGCLLYEMITFTHPFSGRQINELKNNILKNNYRELPSETPKFLQELIEKCLKKDPKERPSSQQILNDEYLRLKYNEYYQKTMQKSKKNEKEYKITCIRILKDITQTCNSVDITKSQLPKSNYFSNEKKKTLLYIKQGKLSSGKRLKSKKKPNQKLITIFNVYNLKPPGFLPSKKVQNQVVKARKLR